MKSLLFGTLFLELIALILPYILFIFIYTFNLFDGKLKYIITILSIILVIGISSFALCNFYIKEECKTSTIKPLIFNSANVVFWALVGFYLPILIPDLAMPFLEILYNLKIPLVDKDYSLEFAKYVAHSFYMFLILLPVSINSYFKCKNAPCKLNEEELKKNLENLKKNDIE